MRGRNPLPAVKLETHETWFDFLLSVLQEQAEHNPYEEYRQTAQKLKTKFQSYGTCFVDGEQKPCVDLRMYPNEAADTIWLLLLCLAEKEEHEIRKEGDENV